MGLGENSTLILGLQQDAGKILGIKELRVGQGSGVRGQGSGVRGQGSGVSAQGQLPVPRGVILNEAVFQAE